MSGAQVTFNSKWTGIQDGLTFKIAHRDLNGVKEAEYLLSQLLQSVSFQDATGKKQKKTHWNLATFTSSF